MTRIASVLGTLVLALQASACGTTSDAAPAPTGAAKAKPASTGDDQALCVEVFTRNRTCTDDYIAALVDLRARYDQPAGIADEVRANRADVIARAKVEWQSDSTDEAIAATCATISANLTEPQRAHIGQARECLAVADCAGYTTCVMPLFEARFGGDR